MRLHTIALGCQMSAADGEEMSRPLLERGFTYTRDAALADAILISTCTVRQHAEDRALSLVGSLRAWRLKDPRRVLIVAGCAAQRLGGWITRRFPHVDLVVGAPSVPRFAEILEEALGRRFDAWQESRGAFRSRELEPLGPGLPATGSPATAFLTIMRGCNYSCSYCVVPSVRGRELYRPVGEILEEARRKISAGARELLLLGQTVNSYRAPHEGGELRFPGLLRLLDRLPGLSRLRFMSPHPHYVDEGLIEAMAQCPRVCESLHLPAQSGSDRLLGLMRRNYTREGFLRRARELRARVRGIVLSTDIIVGFPTETDEDFRETLSFVEELQPASAYCFKYSPRGSTESASWPDDVRRGVKEERLARLNELVGRLTQEALRSRVGRRAEVLVERAGFGRTREGFKVRWTSGRETPPPVGGLPLVSITGTTRRTLLGEIDERQEK